VKLSGIFAYVHPVLKCRKRISVLSQKIPICVGMRWICGAKNFSITRVEKGVSAGPHVVYYMTVRNPVSVSRYVQRRLGMREADNLHIAGGCGLPTTV
jgi:hypothetical protein